MRTYWRGFILSCLLLTLTLTVGIVMLDSIKPEPSASTTTTTTTLITWNKDNLNLLIEKISKEEHFEDTYLLKRLVELESQYLKYPKIVDTNGYYSYSILHFQLYTFLEQAEKFGVIPEDTTLEDGRILIMNPELQLRTICRMGNDDMRTVRNKWYNSWNKIYMCY